MLICIYPRISAYIMFENKYWPSIDRLIRFLQIKIMQEKSGNYVQHCSFSRTKATRKIENNSCSMVDALSSLSLSKVADRRESIFNSYRSLKTLYVFLWISVFDKSALFTSYSCNLTPYYLILILRWGIRLPERLCLFAPLNWVQITWKISGKKE